MKRIALVGTFIYALSLLTSCSRIVGEERPMEGYWRGFYQYKTAVREGKSRPNEFLKEPINLYCKIEQTGDVFVGRYSLKFDAESFKKEVIVEKNGIYGIQKVEGVISGSDVVLRFHDTTGDIYKPPMEAKMKFLNGTLVGEWKIVYENNGSVQVIYSGVVELTKY